MGCAHGKNILIDHKTNVHQTNPTIKTTTQK